MSWFEMSLQVECPRCGEDTHETSEFNMGSADQCGVDSGWYKVMCGSCFKDFWFKARCSFETEVIDAVTKKPKDVV